MRIVFDIEANGLLDESTIDYTASPYKLRDTFKMHCAVAKDMDTQQVWRFVGEEVHQLPSLLEQATEIIAHNGIEYDLLALKLYCGMDFTIFPDTINGKPVKITDTLIMSKTLNPDRPMHSVDYFGALLGLEKIDWRARAIEIGLIEADAPKGAEFQTYHPEMLVYNERDVDVNIKIYHFLVKEAGNWNFSDALQLEHAVKEIISRQSHRGFNFASDKARDFVNDLDQKMEAIREKVEHLIPPKKITKTLAKEYIPPKKQINKDLSLSALMEKFIQKHNGSCRQDDFGSWLVTLFGKEHKIPIPCEPLVTRQVATLDDTTHLKGWLVEDFGWEPSVFKEKDLTLDSKKKKLSPEKYEERVARYVEETLESPFCKHRCEFLNVRPQQLEYKLLNHELKRPLKVLTNPTLTVGQDKDICPNLLALSDKFPHAEAVSEYLTYKHRRNSILGGGLDPDDDEEDYAKGFLAAVREDGRIATPADTCGCGTSRFKHRGVANIARVTSLYGREMRSLFGVSAGFVQVGYDFDALEARIEGHYCMKYDGEEYAASLTAEKPNDIHTVTAGKITKIIGMPFSRGNAKSVKYGCLPVDNSEVLTRDGWKKYEQLQEGEEVLSYNTEKGAYEWDFIKAIWFYENAEVFTMSLVNKQIESTADHRWYGSKKGDDGKRVEGFFTTEEITPDISILNAHYCYGTLERAGWEVSKAPSRTTDVFCITTNNGTFVTRQNGFTTITGNCSYGATAGKVAKIVGCDLETAESIYNAFWDAAEPLKKLKENLTKYWETTGEKKFILGIDGRKIPTRSKHALVNSLFQSAGVICAKRAMVIHDRMLKEEGMAVDFFKDDWKNTKFCQQLIAYHKQHCGLTT